jgi:hypothetical protein
MTPRQCAHPGCECATRANERYCSTSCETAAAQGRDECACGHPDCVEASESSRRLGGNQGEGNREADRRYREKATDFARRTDKT